jgi:hypothetical protein
MWRQGTLTGRAEMTGWYRAWQSNTFFFESKENLFVKNTWSTIAKEKDVS